MNWWVRANLYAARVLITIMVIAWFGIVAGILVWAWPLFKTS